MIQIAFAKLQCDRLWIRLPFYLFIVYLVDFVLVCLGFGLFLLLVSK